MPADDRPGINSTRSRADEPRCIWQACKNCGRFGIIVKVLMLTGQRKNEIACLQSSWIKDDQMTLPKEIKKNAQKHTFSIGPLASSLLSRARSGHHSSFEFCARGSEDRPFSGWSKSTIALDKLLGSDFRHWTFHDLHRTFAANLAALCVRLEVTEKLPNHVSRNLGGIVAVYQRHDFNDEMREAITKWEKRVAEFVEASG